MLCNVVDQRQSTFIGGRNILDGVLITNEIVHEAKVKKNACFIFKTDFEKTYDSVRWEFLAYMLHRLGFCAKWIQCIRGCL